MTQRQVERSPIGWLPHYAATWDVDMVTHGWQRGAFPQAVEQEVGLVDGFSRYQQDFGAESSGPEIQMV